MELLRISIENVLFHLSELFTYLSKVFLLLGQRGSDNRGRTVIIIACGTFETWSALATLWTSQWSFESCACNLLNSKWKITVFSPPILAIL